MIPELRDDWLEKALSARHVAAPPRTFTRSVLDRVGASERRSAPADLVAEHGVRIGLASAAFGLCLVVDIAGPAAAFAAALQTSQAAPAAGIVAICLAWVFTRKEPEGEVL